MFDRHLRPIPVRPTSGLRYRVETLVVSLPYVSREPNDNAS